MKMKMGRRRNWEGEVKVEKGVKFMVLVTNMVAVARHGLILKDGEATRSRKVLKYLTGHREVKQNQKISLKSKHLKIQYFTVFLYELYIGGRRHG